ncbi:DUF3386 family protein [Thermus brockianus]|uniref:Uncharacterized protein n=1 Tax=Thermus brockianus TaxID=56956 RepID=A0ABM7XMR5_THEBO|nr:DUF3386 family protein [Thermus brockianus]BDG17664.1 hypothetical protein TbrSNM41_23980 [Thermus brockianus]
MIESPPVWALLKRARERIYTLPDSFPGFTANVALYLKGLWYFGEVRVEGFHPEVHLPEDMGSIAEKELASLLGHRRPIPFEEGEGRYAMRLVEEGPLGTVIALDDPFRSRIWVRHGRIEIIERNMAEGSFRIHLEAWEEVGEKLLPKRFFVIYRDPKGGILKVERFRDTYAPLAGLWLPVEREVVVEGAGMETLVLRLENVEVRA